MNARQPRAAAEVRIASSRTRTARDPLPMPTPVTLSGIGLAGNLLDFHLGPPQRPAEHPAFPGTTIRYPFDDVALQLYLRLKADGAKVIIVLDFGRNVELARIEMYGNPLLAPVDAAAGPVSNLGIPRAIALGVSEQPFEEADLHRRIERGTFHGDLIEGWRHRWVSHDVRALWGWTPIHLGPCFGRHIVLAFDRLPALPPLGDGTPTWGIDLQRIVFYPYHEDVDHRPHVEHSLVSSRVESFATASGFWSRHGEANPVRDTHQSVLLDESHEALLLPSALSGLPSVNPVSGEVQLYGSDPMPLDAANPSRIVLVTQATADEVPLLEGVQLVFRAPEQKGIYQGPKLPFQPEYLVRVHTTNDLEAAFSPDTSHPSWRLTASERRVRPEPLNEHTIRFAEPVRARWVRLTVRPVPPEGQPNDLALPFVLHRLDLLRCRSWQVTPDFEEEIEIENVLIRLRGERLLDDYAYIDGAHGLGVTVEAAEEDGAFTRIRSFRTLLHLIEETHHRIFANHRRIDKPVQRYHEESIARARTNGKGTQHVDGTSESRVEPEFGNFTATRSGNVTNHVRRPRANLGDAAFTTLPNQDTTGLETTRSYEVDVDDITPPSIDFTNMTPEGIVNEFVQWGGQIAQQGMPVSIGIGGNVGASFGGSFGVQITGSGGLSATVGTQIGGGVTHSTVKGNQGSVVRSESRTLSSFQKLETTSDTSTQSTQESKTRDTRDVTRRDLSKEVRKRGVEIRQGGVYEDLILVTVPVGVRLRGGWAKPGLYQLQVPPRSLECLRVRVEHLPPGVRMDVEFRGRVIPRERRS